MTAARIVHDLPRRVRTVEHAWIPLSDGCRLAARLWLPEGAERAPVPAVLEYIPYGKRIGTRERDDGMHAWFAGHGIAAVRVDLRGSGESEGVLLDEYLAREQEDGVEAIAWIAAQPWCSGAVGMIGKSWGGFNALQIAARRPPALRGIVTVCSTDDRYADDVHYMGGCLLNDNLWWGATFFQLVALPPDPALVGERWRALWRERLEAARPFPLRWLRHPLRDAYWKHGSVREDHGAIACPVLAVGGWADAYTNAVPRLVAGLRAPCRGLVGPWGHDYPHDAHPGPSIGFLQEALAWWRACLEGESALAAGEPAYRAWIGERVPAGHRGDRPGRWVAEAAWPSPRLRPRTLRLAPGRLGDAPVAARLAIASPQTLGGGSTNWLVAGAHDQSADDRLSLCFDGEPLEGRVEILGAPTLRVRVASDRPLAFLVARLCDVAPDGTSYRVTYGLLNLAHGAGHERHEPLVPGRAIEAALRLNDVGHAFLPGHRIRLALSNACWPLVWPSPAPARLTLLTEGCALELPVRPADPEDRGLRPFAPPERAPASSWAPLARAERSRTEALDPRTGELVRRARSGFDATGRVALERLDPADGMQGGDGIVTETRIHPDDPLRASASIEQRTELCRGDWQVAIETGVRIACTATDFVVHARLEAHEAGARVFGREWDERVPRQGV